MSIKRQSPIELGPEEFKKLGYQLIDTISDLITNMDKRPVTSGAEPHDIIELLGEKDLPEEGITPYELISTTTELLLKYSLYNGHPKFLGYITSSPAPLGILADLLASGLNQNMGARILSPVATEIEKQTIKWLCQFVGISDTYGGILVSGGNMANFTAFLAARTSMAPRILKDQGLSGLDSKLISYCSKTTHTWIEKASVLFGQGLESIRWIDTDEENRMDIDKLRIKIQEDLNNGDQPMMVVGTAGDVSTGTVDSLEEIAQICNHFNIWFHIDGAYGAPAAVISELKDLFKGIENADSIALDPHKWLYSPLEAGCTLVKNPKHLTDTFSSNPEYYNFDKNGEIDSLNYYEYGLQNSRGFRALKVWLSLQQVGKKGYIKMIKEDIEVAQYLYHLSEKNESLKAVSQNLSITCFQFIPKSLHTSIKDKNDFLNKLNETLLNQLQKNGEVFLSNAVIKNTYCLRACVVNFRTSKKDMNEIVDVIVQEGNKTYKTMIAEYSLSS